MKGFLTPDLIKKEINYAKSGEPKKTSEIKNIRSKIEKVVEQNLFIFKSDTNPNNHFEDWTILPEEKTWLKGIFPEGDT